MNMADTPCQHPGRGAKSGPGQGPVLKEYGETNAAGSDLGKGPSPPKKGEGVPRELLGYK